MANGMKWNRKCEYEVARENNESRNVVIVFTRCTLNEMHIIKSFGEICWSYRRLAVVIVFHFSYAIFFLCFFFIFGLNDHEWTEQRLVLFIHNISTYQLLQ